MGGSRSRPPARHTSGRGAGAGSRGFADQIGKYRDRVRSGLTGLSPSGAADGLINKWWVLLSLAAAGLGLFWAVTMVGEVPLPEEARTVLEGA